MPYVTLQLYSYKTIPVLHGQLYTCNQCLMLLCHRILIKPHLCYLGNCIPAILMSYVTLQLYSYKTLPVLHGQLCTCNWCLMLLSDCIIVKPYLCYMGNWIPAIDALCYSGTVFLQNHTCVTQATVYIKLMLYNILRLYSWKNIPMLHGQLCT